MTEYVDLLGKSDEHGEEYFEAREFETRMRLEDNHYWHLHRRQVLLGELQRACPDKSLKLLELGCGIGTVATFLNENGYQVDYGDVHRAGLERARRRAEDRLGEGASGRKFLRLDVTQQGLPEGYHGAMLFDVLEHLRDDVRVMQNLRASLADRGRNGFVMFSVPAFQFLWSPWDDIEKHKRRYSGAQARALAESTGFRVERITYFFFPLFFAAAGVKLLRGARNSIRPPSPAGSISELTETKTTPLLNRVMLAALSPERRLLGRSRLPLGTSLLVVARVA
jgi:SAM-dependent methyltransferase